jgi:hypothetical protein
MKQVTIGELETAIEERLRAEGFMTATITLQPHSEPGVSWDWDIKLINPGDDDREQVKGAVSRMIPEMQKQFRIS